MAGELHNWEKKSKEKQKQFKQYLQRADKNKVLKQLPDLHEEAIAKVDCLQCAACCKNYSPRFKTPDIKRISKHLKMKESDFIATYLKVDEEGDFVVHAEYGIAHYAGIQRMPDLHGDLVEVLVLEFVQEAKLFVPLDQAWQVSRYVGVGKAIPSLSSLESDRWTKTRAAAEKSVFLYA